jgi:hypothetical protein
MSLFPLLSLALLLIDLVLECKGNNLHFSKKDQCTAMINSRKLEEFETYFEVLEREVFHEVFR